MAHSDVLVKLREDKAFRDKYINFVQMLRMMEEDPSISPTDEAVARVVGDMWKHCGFNAGLLLPYFFPNCGFLDNHPLSLTRRPFAFCFYTLTKNMILTIKGSRQIAKTSNLVGRQQIYTQMLPNYQFLHIVPHQQHLETFGTKFREMERAFLYRGANVSDKTMRDNLYLKEYPNGSKVSMFKVTESADPVRGQTAKEVDFDEYQLFNTDCEEDILQILKTSKMKNFIYAGTSTSTDTPLEARYNHGSQGVWMVRCNDGKRWLNMSDREDLWSLMHPDGPRCPTDGKPIHLARGEWVHADQVALDAGRPSYHVPQVIIPEYVDDVFMWRKDIYEKWLRDRHNPNKILQEIFGIATEEGSRELTLQHLKDICVVEGSWETRRESAKDGRVYRFIISGCDWGGSDYNVSLKTKSSVTAHTILGVKWDGTFDILHMRTYSGMEYEYIADCIVKDHKAFNGTAIASDYGGGQLYNNLIRKHPLMDPTRHFVFFYTAPVTRPVAATNNDYFNMFSLNKTESLTSLILSIRSTTPRIRCYNFQEAEYELSLFLNSFRIPQERDHGVASFVYRRHGSKPDDTLHATNYAFQLGRMMMHEPIVDDPTVSARLAAMFGTDYGSPLQLRVSAQVMPSSLLDLN